MESKRVHLFISGRVQGVWYRASMSNEGVKIGLNGWVRNLDDGRVEAVVEGMEDDVQKMIAWCRKGPPMARVDDLDVLERFEAELEALDGEFLVVDEDGPDCHVVWCAFGGRVEVTTAEGAEGFLGGAA